MTTLTNSIAGRLLSVVIPLLLGVLAIVFAGNLRSNPDAAAKTPPPRPVRVMTVKPQAITPSVSGFGTVQPAQEWRAVARVEGDVVWLHESLAQGNIIAADTEILRLDDTQLRLTLAQLDAQLSALEIKTRSLRANLTLAEQDKTLSDSEKARQQSLAKRGLATESAREQAERQSLNAQSQVTALQNDIAISAAERKVLQAQRELAERDLSFTHIRTPYAVRIGEVQTDIGQYVSRGQVLASAEGTAAVEIAAQFPIGRLAPLTHGNNATSLEDLKATVRLTTADHAVSWPACIDRIGDAIDARTQSVDIIATIEQPQDFFKPGERPQLLRNMFVELSVSGAERKALIIPADALSDNAVYRLDENDSLVRQPVAVAFVQDGKAVIREGLSAGDRVVLTDASLLMPGMVVKPIDAARAAGKKPASDSNGKQP